MSAALQSLLQQTCGLGAFAGVMAGMVGSWRLVELSRERSIREG